MKKYILLIAVAAFMYSCGNQNAGGSDNKSGKADSAKQDKEATIMKTHELMNEIDKHVGEEVTFKGRVVHVCQHGGKRMFVDNKKNDERLKVTAGDKVGAFKQKDAGSKLKITGTVKEEKINEAYLDHWEKEIKENASQEHKIHEGDHEEGESHKDHDAKEDLAKVDSMRKELKESEKDHLSIYSVEAKSYKKE